MRIETTYYAFDGTEFDDKEECLDYEEHLKGMSSLVAFFDEDKRMIDSTSLEMVESNAIYIVILSNDVEKVREYFKWLEEQTSFEAPSIPFERGDVFKWTDDGGFWVDLRTRARRINEDIAHLTKESGLGEAV